ncbi:MAG: sigma-70 family RNA polymerase sigma factor, partial [Christensenellaceae bacterium]|nr:sigma-70 family RNA polymerase sigma factor [Christensenellaceae bacterium]MEA5067446.1 sigma-70 family RNA polymerase sigma factor [Christensenellaceae bacterium]
MMMLPIAIARIEDAGERVFMARLYQEQYDLMYAQARRLLDVPQDAEDTVQEAAERLIKQVAVLMRLEDHQLRAYVIVTVRSVALDLLRKNDHIHGGDPEDMFERIPSSEEDVDAALLWEETVTGLVECIERLPERDQTALGMKYVREMSDGEIA